MGLNDLSNLFMFAGGIGMFLYGMNLMADGMQKSAGGRMQKLLGMLTSNRFLAICVGALITAIIQSSGATTVMVVGFVNAGILSLTQAVGVIFGANIGTTITAWIVSLSQLGEAAEVLNPTFYAPLIVGIGAIVQLFSKKAGRKNIGEILVGIGFLFMGLDFMSGSVKPYTDAPIFVNAFRIFGANPLLGILVGIIVTAILQSSSASVGILQTLAANGIVGTNAAIFITLGQNIGSCVTAMISSIGANRNAKRAAVMHLMFNLFGAVIFGVAAVVIFTIWPQIAAYKINVVEISMFHTFFNISNTLICLPMAQTFVKVSGMLIPEKQQPVEEEDGEIIRKLDPRILENPSFAVETALNEVVEMGTYALDNIKKACDAVLTNNLEEIELVLKQEKLVDKYEKYLTDFLVKVSNLSLNEKQNLKVNNLFHAVIDFERISDHAENMVELAQYKVDNGIEFSETGHDEMKDTCSIVIECVEAAVQARKTGAMEYIRKVIRLEDMVDNLEEELRDKHIERLSQGLCKTSSGVVFLDLLTNLERISDHANNIVGCVKNEI
jgi:phosphate:Na+ symporter